jgi:O-antigen/teichoic acid export membrane protein
LCVAFVVLLATAGGFFYLDRLFNIPPRLLSQARLLFLLSGASIALSFPLNIFGGVLEGLQKFSWLHLSQVGVVLVRAALIVLALRHGEGLLAVGTITVVTNLLSSLIFAAMAISIFPATLSSHHVEWSAFRKMAGYGVFAFAIIAAEKLRFQSDALVIGVFLSSTAITAFSIGAKLVEYSSYAVRSMAQIFTPMSSQLEATGDSARLRRAFLAGNRACALITFPVCIALVILGRSVITAWVGPRYVSSYSILVLLIVPRSFYLAQSISMKILLGMGKHRVLGVALVIEGVCNLVLSSLLARRYGIAGVALGTAIPLACTSLLFLPRHLCHVLGVPLGKFVSQAYRLPLLACVPFAAVLWLIRDKFAVPSYRTVLLQIGCGSLVYAATLLFTVIGEAGIPRSWQAFAQLLESK